VADPSFDDAIAILGGTGEQGLGLALRFATADRPVLIGSRSIERANAAAERVRATVPGAEVSGGENPEVCRGAQVIILSVPFEHTASTVNEVRDALIAGQIVVSMGVPLATAAGGPATQTIGVWQGSCAEMVAALLPKGVHTVSALQNVAAHRLHNLDRPVDCDVVVSGAEQPRKRIMELCELVPGLRGIDGGPLANARIAESITALLIGLNIRYRVSGGTGIRFTGLPDGDA
jgi:NADPH-dependent F420 reductase